MSLSAVLVDRARLQRKTATPVKVGGRTSFVNAEPGSWFDARLMLPNSTPEQTPAGFVSKRVVFVPTLIFDVEDEDGNEVQVRFNDVLEVESEDLGNDSWQVTAEPQPFRKREGIIGFQVPMQRVETRDFVPRV